MNANAPGPSVPPRVRAVQTRQRAPIPTREPRAWPPGLGLAGSDELLRSPRRYVTAAEGESCGHCPYSIRIHVDAAGTWLGCPAGEADAVMRWGAS